MKDIQYDIYTNHQIGGKKAAEKLVKSDPEFYHKLGSKGGKSTQAKYKGSLGFAGNPELARRAGQKGGLAGRGSKRRPSPERLKAELDAIALRITAMAEPPYDDTREIVAGARKIAAKELRHLGFTYRQIAQALGLKSTNSVRLYLIDDDAADS